MKTYQIRTLADIYALPDAATMQRCMEELTAGMLFARANEEAIAEHCGREGDRLFEWPETLEWKDDGKGEVEFRLVDETGAALWEIALEKAKGGVE